MRLYLVPQHVDPDQYERARARVHAAELLAVAAQAELDSAMSTLEKRRAELAALGEPPEGTDAPT